MTRIIQLLESINTYLQQRAVEKQVLEREEAAKYCGLGLSTFNLYVSQNYIRRVRFPGLKGRQGGKKGFRRRDLDEFIDSLEEE